MQTSACLLSGVICRRSVRPIRSEFSDGWRVYLYVLLEISPNLPSNQPYLIGKSVLIETHRAGAPFPHCGAAHDASGGPRAGPENSAVVASVAKGREAASRAVERPPGPDRGITIMLWPASGGSALRNTRRNHGLRADDGVGAGGREWSRVGWEREHERAAVPRAVSMAPPAAARAMTDCAGMLFMSFSAAAWLQHPMTTPAFARGRLDVLGG